MSRSPSVGERTTTVLNTLSCLDIPIGHYKMLPWQRERQKSNTVGFNVVPTTVLLRLY